MQDKKARKLTKKRVRVDTLMTLQGILIGLHFLARYPSSFETQVGGTIYRHPGKQEDTLEKGYDSGFGCCISNFNKKLVIVFDTAE